MRTAALSGAPWAGSQGFDVSARMDSTGGDVPAMVQKMLADRFRALEEQLGLKLEATRIDADTIVIEHAEKPGEN